MAATETAPKATRKKQGRQPEPIEAREMVWPTRFEILSFDRLFVDDEYQRPLTSMADEIGKSFDEFLFGAALVSNRGKAGFAVVDGQNRIEGAKRNGISEGPCLIYENLSQEEEASLFWRFQDKRRNVTPLIRLRARLRANEPIAKHLTETIKAAGFEWSDQMAPGKIRAVVAIERIYQRDLDRGRADLPAVLQLVQDTWPDNPYGPSEVILYGIQQFLVQLDQRGEELDEERFVRHLGRVQPSDLATRANQLKEAKGLSTRSPKLTAEAMEAEYYKRGRPRRS